MATKGMIKALFTAIRNGEDTVVRRMVEEDAELVNVTRSAPPKKDDGQSPLQVAFKTGRLELAQYLIDKGADVNFIETSTINEWRAPVLHDALRATVFNMPIAFGTEASFQCWIDLIQRMLKLGADPNGRDSFGNSSLLRVLLDLRQVLLSKVGGEDRSAARRHAGFDLYAQQVLMVLKDAGADPHQSDPRRESVVDYVRGSYFEQFFNSNRPQQKP